MNQWKVILATMVIYGCGVVTGGLLMKSDRPAAIVAPEIATHPAKNETAPPFAQIQRLEFLKRMERQLDLTSEQRDKIAKIMKSSQERSKPLWDQIAPEMRVEIKRVREEIRETLTPPQQKRMDELLRPRVRKVENANGVPHLAPHSESNSVDTNAL